MKLGLILKITNDGEAESIAVNKNEAWAKFAADSRSTIKELSGFDGTEKSIILLKFLGSIGYLVGVVKARPEGSGRAYDNTTAWIFVPATISITGQQLVSVIHIVEEEISARKGINRAKLQELFEQEYPEKHLLFAAVAFLKSNTSGELGGRMYGDGTDCQLHELLGNSVAQTIYNDYKSICFINAASGIALNNGKLIKNPIRPIITTLNPVDRHGFRPYIVSNNKLINFTAAIEIPLNTRIHILWKKEGYSDIKKEYVASDKNDRKIPEELEIKDIDRKIVVARSWIKVYDKNNNQLQNSTITINDATFRGETMEIPEATFVAGVKLCVQHPGFDEYNETNCKLTRNTTVKLENTIYRKEYTLPRKEGKNLDSDARIIIEMPGSCNEIPLKGYTADNRGYMHYGAEKDKIRYFLMGLLSAIVVALLSLVIWMAVEYFGSHELRWGWPPVTEIRQTDSQQP